MPTIVTRAQWGARPPAYSIPQTSWASRTGFVVHYSAASASQSVRTIQDFHIGKGWGDVGYNWLVGVDGRIYEGRQGTWAAIGAHAANHNTANVGVCMIGTDADVTDAAKASIRWLYDTACRLAGKTLAKRYHGGLSGASTSCPGAHLRDWVTAGMPVPTTPPEEDDMQLTDVVPSAATPDVPKRNLDMVLGDAWRGVHVRLPGMLAALDAKLDAVAAKVDIDPAELAAVAQAAREGATAGVAAGADELVAAVIAGLPESGLTRDDVEAAIRSVLGGLDTSPNV